MPKLDYIYSDPTISTSAKDDTPYGIYDNDTAFISESVDVAKSFGARVEFFEWIDDFSAARNESIKYANGNWIFWFHNGKKELECDIDFGEAINSARVYHDNGLLKQEVKL